MANVPYRDVVSFELAEREAYTDPSYRPVFRSSALFVVRHDDDVRTFVTFMNYWSLKNGNDDVSLLLTLRDRNGEIVARRHQAVEGHVHRFDVGDLTAERPFLGSLELEFHSSRDLKYAVPAVVAAYRTRDGLSFVHANQRTFNDLTDLDRNAGYNRPQTGFDTITTVDTRPFVSFVNGPRPVTDGRLDAVLATDDGRSVTTGLDLGPLPPYACRWLHLDELPGANEVSGGSGFARIDVTTEGVFNRLAVGNVSSDGHRLAVTHSYYDCSGDADYEDVVGEDEYPAVLPFLLVPGLDLDLVFYPIFCASDLHLRLLSFLEAGTEERDLGRFRTDDGRVLRLHVSELLRSDAPTADEHLHAIVFEAVHGLLPARMTFGMNLRGSGFGSNINDSVSLASGYGVRRRLYTWGPLFIDEGSRNLISVTHLEKVLGSVRRATVTIRLYDAQGPLAEDELVLENGTGRNIDVQELLTRSRRQADGDVIWYTVESAVSALTVRHIHISPLGFVGADHGF